MYKKDPKPYCVFVKTFKLESLFQNLDLKYHLIMHVFYQGFTLVVLSVVFGMYDNATLQKSHIQPYL